jgi:hypothetical protein
MYQHPFIMHLYLIYGISPFYFYKQSAFKLNRILNQFTVLNYSIGAFYTPY